MAWNSQESIAELMEVGQPSVVNIIDNIKNRQMSIFDKDFKPLLYSIWNQAKQEDGIIEVGRILPREKSYK